ncbi:general odorant-binding protein 28a-like [Anopheles nili]|uniref:general odorant-binding protein 28a-like n=1 Tax=Anopheles nili TaxID=185578 RepID=UPI00237B4AAD|nr:general odorant-binding protein 28a-like [Anopheles nili]
MKFAVTVLSVFAVLIASASAQNEKVDQAKEMLRGLAAECKTKEGASDADLEVFINDEPLATPQQKCLAACLMEQFGASDGKSFQEAGFIEVGKMYLKDDSAKIELLTQIAADCKQVANADRCELAVQISTCLKDSAAKHGMAFKH